MDALAPDMNANNNTEYSDKMDVFTGSTLTRSFDDRSGSARPSFSSFRCPSKPLPSASGRGFLDPKTVHLSDLNVATRQKLQKMTLPPPSSSQETTASLPVWPPIFPEWPGIDDNKC